jgi:transposase
MVKQRFELKPEICPCGSRNLEETNQELLRHQIVDIPPIRPEVIEYIQKIHRCKACGKLLEETGGCECALSGKCRRIIKHREHLWTFVQDQGVDPTNNLAERIVRQGVLWLKSSFGTQSERGARYVERILTACATCRLQGRSIIEYLREACRCHLDGVAVPSLIKSAGNLAKSARTLTIILQEEALP